MNSSRGSCKRSCRPFCLSWSRSGWGFMWRASFSSSDSMTAIGHIALWKSLLTSAIFTVLMFITFEIAFDVIMPKGPIEALLGY